MTKVKKPIIAAVSGYAVRSSLILSVFNLPLILRSSAVGVSSQ
jgi:hypothetical protein